MFIRFAESSPKITGEGMGETYRRMGKRIGVSADWETYRRIGVGKNGSADGRVGVSADGRVGVG